jgi:4-amino-4-deoxy-L-arabinose transferase-like glycosyltransferase
LTISEKRYLLRDGSIVTCILLLVTFAVVWQVNIKDPYIGNYDEGDFLLAARQVLEGRRLFTDVFSAQPPLYLEMIALAFRFFGDTLVVGREMTIFFALICLATVALITWRIAGPLSVPIAIFSLGLQSQFFKDAKVAMADIPSLAYALLAMACALPTRSRRYGAWLVLAGACFALSLLTKLLTISLIMPLLLLVVLSAPANESLTWHLP